jgi:iron complex outermembrane receptor protein
VQTQGIDVTADYRVNVGAGSSVSFDLVGSYLDSYKVETTVGSPKYECAGAFGRNCGAPSPKWRHKFRATYQMADGIGLTGAWRYFGGSTNDAITVDQKPVNPDVAKSKPVSYFDLSMVARVGDNYTFRLGAQNLLDKTPPVLDSNYTTNGSGTYAEVYDALGRYVYAAVSLNF